MIRVKNIEIGTDKILLFTEKGNGYYPFSDSVRLSNATPAQRNRYSLSPFGIHWAEIDEDLCFDGFLFDRKMNGQVRYV
jgi:hypothetical protein